MNLQETIQQSWLTSSSSENHEATMDISTTFEDALGQYVRQAFSENERWRRSSGVEERLLRALRARRYKYDPEDISLVGGIDIYIGLSALKSRAAGSWINDIVLNSIDKPWLLKPTPIPELPEWLKEQVVDALQMELQQAGLPMDIRARAKQLKDAALKYAQDKAQAAADRMESTIEDQLLEGGWRTLFAEFIDDLTTFPAAFIRTPVIENQKRLAWDGNTLVQKNQVIYTSRRISPFDAYPSMDSSNSQNGQHFIERLQLQVDNLYSMIGLDGFNEEAIRQVIDEYGESGFREYLKPDFQRKYLEDKYLPPNERKTIDTLIYNGKIQGKMLLENNILVPDRQEYYEVEIWTVNNRTIKAILNPYPLAQRPIFSTSFIKVPGSLWGEGVCDILRDVQRMVNSSARSIARNMSYASGPLTEVDVGRLADGEKPDEIIPYRVYGVDTDPMGHGTPAFKFNQVPIVAPQLREIMEYFSKIADDLSGIPAYVLGSPQVSGAGRTLGGLSMMMGNAAKGIKNVILNVDRDVIEPAINLYYNINMINGDDPQSKADAQIVSRGATGLLQRELSYNRMSELMQTWFPYYQAGLIPQQGMQIILRESMKGSGLPVDDIIPDPGRLGQLHDELGRLGVATAMQTGTNNPAPLDGRSAPPPFPQQSIPGGPPFGNPMSQMPQPTNLPQGA